MLMFPTLSPSFLPSCLIGKNEDEGVTEVGLILLQFQIRLLVTVISHLDSWIASVLFRPKILLSSILPATLIMLNPLSRDVTRWFFLLLFSWF